jgi:hypothetical protein
MFERGSHRNTKNRGCGTGGLENGKREIPEHLINLFDKFEGELNEQEQTQLSELVCEFEDVLAKSEFD